MREPGSLGLDEATRRGLLAELHDGQFEGLKRRAQQRAGSSMPSFAAGDAPSQQPAGWLHARMWLGQIAVPACMRGPALPS